MARERDGKGIALRPQPCCFVRPRTQRHTPGQGARSAFLLGG